MNRGYVLTPLTEADLDDIWDYVAERFGYDLVDEMLESLHPAFRSLAGNPEIGHTGEDIAPPPYSFWSVGPSLIALRPDVRPDVRPAQVIRVVRGERDWSRLPTTARPAFPGSRGVRSSLHGMTCFPEPGRSEPGWMRLRAVTD